MITVKDWMSKPVLTTKPGTSVLEAAKKMTKHNIGSIVISEDGKKPLGIITERDVLKKVIAQKVDAEKTNVDEIMTKKPLSVDVETSLLDISKIMNKNSLRRILVTQKDEMIGIVTSRDLLQLMAG